MAVPNSEDMNIISTEAVIVPSARSTGSKTKEISAKAVKDNANGSKNKDKPVKAKPSVRRNTNDQNKQGQNPSQKPKSKDVDRLDGIEKLLIQMHRDAREHKQDMQAKMEKLESDYSQLGSIQYDQYAAGSSQDPEGFVDYPNYQGYADSVQSSHPEQDEQSEQENMKADETVENSENSINNLLKTYESKDDTNNKETSSKPRRREGGFASKFIEAEEVGPPVAESLAVEVEDLMSNKLRDTEITSLLTKYVAPSNLKRLKSPKVNPTIWATLTPKTKSYDIRLQRVQTSMVRGLCAMMHSMGDTATEQQQQAMTLLCNANNELNVARKDHIKPELNRDYIHLCQKPTGIDFLFGDDLPKTVKDLKEEKLAVMACLKSEKKNYGNKRFHPYQNYTPPQQNFPPRRGNRPFLGNRGGQYHNPQTYPYQYQNMQPQRFNRGRGRWRAASTMTRPSH
jgi:hypothetical protein